MDVSSRAAFFRDKRVLVTGAAGSVGAALCARLAEQGCASLAMLDQYDHGLLCITEKIQRDAVALEVTDALCSVRDEGRLNSWMQRLSPDVVIHAAALKHVHLGERHPAECILTNLIGVRNSVLAAARAGASHFMLISSDKAASPTSVMGASKRLAELFLQGCAIERSSAMRMRSVRFGNVVGSQGSVIPRFEAQIDSGGPLEVTHAEMERFFMSSDEAVQLILDVVTLEDPEASRIGAYFLDMGEPVSILGLGRDLIRKSGRPIEIKFTGLRPGEKLREQLFDEYEMVAPTSIAGVHRITTTASDAHVSSADVAYLETSAQTMEDAVIRQRVFARLDARLQRETSAAG